LSFWLALVFVVGSNAHVSQLLVWGVGLGAGVALLGALIAPMLPSGLRLGWAIGLSLALFGLCAVMSALHAPRWLPWCVGMGTFCFFGVAIAEAIWSPRNRGTMAPADA
jgi:hypothetical protein